MASQYTPNRPSSAGKSRTILRAVIAVALIIAVYQGYPVVRGLWQQWMPGAAPRDLLEEARQQQAAGDKAQAALLLDEGLAAETAPEKRYDLLRMRIDLAREIPELSAADIGPWLKEHAIDVLNVAGPRESSAPGIYDRSYAFLIAIFRPPGECLQSC